MSAERTDLPGARQLLLQHAYSPLISVQSTRNADLVFQRVCNNHSISALSAFRSYGNNAKYGIANQTYRITNTSLITRNYGSFPVRFEPSLPELLTVHNLGEDKLTSLFSISSLELLMRKLSLKKRVGQNFTEHDLYLSMFRRVITSNRVVSFDTFNHPVGQIFVIDFEHDTLENIRQTVVEFRNYSFPRYFQISDLLIHVFVLYDEGKVSETHLVKFQTSLRTELSLASTLIPCTDSKDPDEVTIFPELENATIEQEVQNITLQQRSEVQGSELRVPKSLDLTLRVKIHEFLSRALIPHMERKIRIWDDSVLAPKKSIAGRFFSVSRKLFNNSSSGDNVQLSTTPGTYNHTGNFYHRSAPEQIIRKLADWSLMLKDFKYAYSTYDILKKDYTNDKAWAYVASTQEMCIVSLLLAQTQPLGSDTYPQKPDKNTLRKIRHDIIEPYIDNLVYTYKSRLNVKTYTVRAYLVVAELLFNMSMMFNIPWWWTDLIEDYFMSAEIELAVHLSTSGRGPQATRAILYARLGFVKTNSFFIPTGRSDIINNIFQHGIVSVNTEQIEEGFYVNEAKLTPFNDNAVKGLTRFRKSTFWYIMSMKEWSMLENPSQIQILMENLHIRYVDIDESGQIWYNRENLALDRVKQFVENPVN